MRVFIAIEFDQEMKDYFSQTQTKLMEFSKKGNYTPVENFHLTLRFIGEVTKNEVQPLMIALEESVSRAKSFPLQLSHLGFFPKGKTTVVWAGLNKSPQLEKMFSNLEKNLNKQGFKRDRKAFNAHVTLGRDVELVKKFDQIKELIPLEKKEFKVAKVSLMESKRVGAKMVYVPLMSVELK